MNENFIKISKLGELSNKMNAQKNYCWNLSEFYNARIESIVQHSAFKQQRSATKAILGMQALPMHNSNSSKIFVDTWCRHLLTLLRWPEEQIKMLKKVL